MTIDTIRKQLSTLNPVTVPRLNSSLAYFDYWRKYKPVISEVANHTLVQSFFLL
jgi:hypothetical protein